MMEQNDIHAISLNYYHARMASYDLLEGLSGLMPPPNFPNWRNKLLGIEDVHGGHHYDHAAEPAVEATSKPAL